jgi:hypothetical protein
MAGVFAAAAAIVVGLYVLKLRRRVVAVPFAPLWTRVLAEKETTSLFSKLRRLLSLLLQLVMVALLVLALGDPRAKGALLGGRHIVLLIDASASMQATDGAPTRLASAKDEAKKLVRGLSAGDQALVAQMDGQVTPLSAMSSDTVELERAVDAVVATDMRADFPRALRFARDVLRGLDRAEVIVLSDGNLADAKDGSGDVPLDGVALRFVPVGSSADNAGITQFSVRRYPLDKSRYEVMLEVTNTGPSDMDVELELRGDGAVVELTRLRLRAGERLPRFYPNLSGAQRELEARLRPVGGVRDVLPADDRAYALLPERARTKVLAVGEGNMYLSAALLLDELLDVTEMRPAAFASVQTALFQPRGAGDGRSGGSRPDVVIFDGVTPAAPVPVPALYLDPRGPGSPVGAKGTMRDPGFDKVERKHPLTQSLALDSVNIAAARVLVPDPRDKVVGSSNEGPLLVAGSRAGSKFVALGFDVRQSDWPLRPAWPLFVLNSLRWLADEEAGYLSSYRTGDVWRIPVGDGALRAVLRTPDGQQETLAIHQGRASYEGRHAGIYELTVFGAGEEPRTVRFAANLSDERESRVAPQSELRVGDAEARPPEGGAMGVRRDVWVLLLLAVALLTAIEWATYHRRVTV